MYTCLLSAIDNTPLTQLPTLPIPSLTLPPLPTIYFILPSPLPPSLQLTVSLLPLLSTPSNLPLPTTQIRHAHNLYDKARPAGKMLRALSQPCFGIILFPPEPGFSPCVVDCFDEVETQVAV